MPLGKSPIGKGHKKKHSDTRAHLSLVQEIFWRAIVKWGDGGGGVEAGPKGLGNVRKPAYQSPNFSKTQRSGKGRGKVRGVFFMTHSQNLARQHVSRPERREEERRQKGKRPGQRQRARSGGTGKVAGCRQCGRGKTERK